MDSPRVSGRIQELDLLRFIAAMAVVFYHRIWIDTHFAPWITSATKLGFLGVHLFFTISGFVILWTAMDRNAWQFLASRISRLYPSFWVGLAITSILLWIARDGVPLTQLAANATMFPHAFRQLDIDPAYWTLAMEWRFYFLICLLLLFKQIHRIELWLSLWLAGSVIAALLPDHWIVRQVTLSGYSVFFIAGGFAYLIRGQVTVRRIALFALSAAMGVWHVITSSQDYLTGDRSIIEPAAVTTVMLIVFFVFATGRITLPKSRTWYWLGALTYPLYLLHYMAGNVIQENLPTRWSVPTRTALAICVAIAAAALVAATVEQRVCPTFHRWLLALPERIRLRRQGLTAVKAPKDA